MKKEMIYTHPEITVVEVIVEQCFATSGDGYLDAPGDMEREEWGAYSW